MKVPVFFSSLVLALPLLAQMPVASPASVGLTAPANSTTAATQAITVTGIPGQIWRVQAVGGSWLRFLLSPTCPASVVDCTTTSTLAGTTSITVLADPTGLMTFNYAGSITVTYPGGVLTIPVTFAVGGNVSLTPFTATPSSLTFSAAPGGASQSQNVALTGATANGGAIFFAASANVPWLSTSLSSGSVFTPSTVSVTADPTGLAPGTYQGTVTFTPAGGSAQPLLLAVTFNVAAVQQFVVNPPLVTFSSASGFTPVPLSIGISSGNPVTYTAAVSYPGLAALRWLTTSATTGQTGTPLILYASGANLPVGTYTATLTISAPGLASVNIPVTLNNGAGPSTPRIVADVNSLAFSQSASTTATRSFVLSTTTGASIPFAVTPQYVSPQVPSVNWLTVTNAVGTTTGTVTVNVNPGNLPAGTYTANLNVTSSTAGFTPLVIPVTLAVIGGQALTVAPSTLSFTFIGNGPIPSNQNIQLNLNPASPTQPVTVSAVYDVPGQTWLNTVIFTAAAGTITPGTQINVGVNPAGLTNGTYTAKIRIQVPNGAVSNSPFDVPVSLVVAGVAPGALPTVLFSPASFTFGSALSGAPADQSLTLTTTAAATVAYTVSGNASWITILNGSGSTPGTAIVRVNPTGLSAGTYNGLITLNAPGAANNGATVPVTLSISATNQSLVLSPTGLRFVAQSNGTPPSPQAVSVSSTGSTATYTVTSNQTWLQGIGSTDSTPGSIAVYVNPTGLPPGTYSGSLTVFSSVFSLNLPVTLEVTSGAVLRLSQSSVTFNYQTGQPIPAQRTILVTPSSAGVSGTTITASTSAGGNWLTVSPGTIPTPGAFSVSLANNIVTALPAGTYTGTVTVSANGAPNSTLNVTLNVAANSLLSMSTAPANFGAEPNGNAPPAQTRPVASTGGNLNLAVTSSTNLGGNWLTATLSATTANSGAPAILTIRTSPTGLAAGVYSGSVTVSSGNTNTVANSANELVVPVTMVVSPLASLNVDQSELLFSGPTSASPQTFQINSSSGNLGVNISAVVLNSSTNWLSVSVPAGVTPLFLTATANPASLNDGTYFGLITITPANPGVAAINIPVTLIVNRGTVLQVTPTSLSFTQVRGSSPLAAQTVQVNSAQPTAFTVTAVVQTPAGSNWLAVSPSGTQTNATLQVGLTAAASVLPIGTYSGTVLVSVPGQSVTVPIAVSLTVVGQIVPVAFPSTLNFSGRAGAGNPPAQTVQVSSSVDGTPVFFNVLVDSPWISVTPLSSFTPATLSVGVLTANLPPNTPVALGRITLVPLVGGTTTTINVSYTTEAAPPLPPPVISSFANAATFLPGSLSPGMLFSVFGTNLGPVDGVAGTIAQGRFTTSAGNVRVLLDGIPAPVLFANATQINAAVPYQLAGRAFAQMTVEYNGVVSNSVAPRLVDTAPGIFTTNGRQAAALNSDGSVNSAANPAAAGSIVVLFLTGEGITTPGGVDGELVPATNLRRPVAPVQVRVNGAAIPAADVLYAGSAPTLVAGLMQINFRLPAGTPASAATSVEVVAGAAQSPLGVTIAVR
ncbi:MAG: hypothetical protein K2X03_27195 [Bryobacteraceae bacterium]|nr:hypothetical protein [Bryobacteraceae bacterium]